jgi:hypothetical protein
MPDLELPTGSESGLQMLASIGTSPHGCTYLSTPITTGPAFLKWKRSLGHNLTEKDRAYWTGHRQSVIEENKRRIAPIAESLRRALPHPLIDPTQVDVPGWEQIDYHRFWCEVIRRWCSVVVLSAGWEFSTGCCFEALTALTEGIPVVDEELRAIEDCFIITSVEQARDELVRDDMASEPYIEATSALVDLISLRNVAAGLIANQGSGSIVVNDLNEKEGNLT